MQVKRLYIVEPEREKFALLITMLKSMMPKRKFLIVKCWINGLLFLLVLLMDILIVLNSYAKKIGKVKEIAI